MNNLTQNRMMKESESKVPRHSGTMGAKSDAFLVGTRMAVESSKQALIRPGRNEPEAWDRTTRAGPGGLAFGGRSVPDGAEAAHLIDRR